MRTASGLGPGFTATEGRQGLGVSLRSVPSSLPRLPRHPSGHRRSCVRLPSLADGAIGAHLSRVPNNGTPLLRAPSTGEGGPLDSGVLPAPGGGAAPISPLSVSGARPAGSSAASTTSGLDTPPPPQLPADLPASVAVIASSLATAIGGSGRGREAEASKQSNFDSSCAGEPKTSIRDAGARSPVVVSAPAREQSSRRLVGTTSPASSLTTQPQSGGEGHQSSAVTSDTQPGSQSGRLPTPACPGHRPSTLDSQEGRYRCR